MNLIYIIFLIFYVISCKWIFIFTLTLSLDLNNTWSDGRKWPLHTIHRLYEITIKFTIIALDKKKIIFSLIVFENKTTNYYISVTSLHNLKSKKGPVSNQNRILHTIFKLVCIIIRYKYMQVIKIRVRDEKIISVPFYFIKLTARLVQHKNQQMESCKGMPKFSVNEDANTYYTQGVVNATATGVLANYISSSIRRIPLQGNTVLKQCGIYNLLPNPQTFLHLTT